MSGPDDDPVRIVALPFAGDAWTVDGTQLAPALTAALPRVRVTTGAPLRWTVKAYDGVGPTASPVAGDATTASTAFAKIRPDRRGVETVALTVPTGQLLTGKQVTEKDVSASEIGVISFVGAVVDDTAAALWVFCDAGGSKVDV